MLAALATFLVVLLAAMFTTTLETELRKELIRWSELGIMGVVGFYGLARGTAKAKNGQ